MSDNEDEYTYKEYSYDKWEDHFEDGGVVQVGTPLDAKHFNHMEEGIRIANMQMITFCVDGEGYLCYGPAEEVPNDDYYGSEEDGDG